MFVVAFLVAAYFAADYTRHTATINTDTSKMLANSLGFQQRAQTFNEAFPDAKHGLTIIIRAKTADEAESFSTHLALRLKSDP